MVSVSIADNQTMMPLDRRWFRDLAKYVCESEGVRSAKLSLAFVDNPTIHKLNQRFLQHDYPTDVLTFPMSAGKTLEGEIVLSTEYAAGECEEYGWPIFMEASLYVVHGILHLTGYDDKDEGEAQKMQTRQESLLREFAAQRPDQPYAPFEAAAPPTVAE